MNLARLIPWLHILVYKLQWLGVHRFWYIWLAITGASLVCAAWLLRLAATAGSESQKPRPAGFGRSRASVVSSILMGLFLAGYIAAIVAGEDFALSDSSQFTAYSVRGINLPVRIWKEGGRFYPLAMQQFNVIGRLSGSVFAYHAFQIAELLVLVGILLVLDEELTVAVRSALAAVALLMTSVVTCFSGLFFQESDIIFWLASMALGVKLFARTKLLRWALLAVFSAQVALYYKEPVFVFLLSFAAIRIVLRVRGSGTIAGAFREAETRLDLLIGAVSLAFAGYYAVVILAGSSLQYLADRHHSPAGTIGIFLRLDYLIWIFAVFTVVRMYRVIRRAAAPALLWDGLACGALAYFAAYLGMRMANQYYLAPADLIAVLYLGRFLYRGWNGMSIPVKATVVVLGSALMFQNLHLSAYYVLDRKWRIERRQRIADVLLERYKRDSEHPLRIYFPFSSQWDMAEYAAYLNYRGLTVEESTAVPGSRPRVELYSLQMQKTDRCVMWLPFICHSGGAEQGTVTVVLPEDVLLSNQFKLYREAEQQLLAGDPRSPYADLLSRAVQFLRPGSGTF